MKRRSFLIGAGLSALSGSALAQAVRPGLIRARARGDNLDFFANRFGANLFGDWIAGQNMTLSGSEVTGWAPARGSTALEWIVPDTIKVDGTTPATAPVLANPSYMNGKAAVDFVRTDTDEMVLSGNAGVMDSADTYTVVMVYASRGAAAPRRAMQDGNTGTVSGQNCLIGPYAIGGIRKWNAFNGGFMTGGDLTVETSGWTAMTRENGVGSYAYHNGNLTELTDAGTNYFGSRPRLSGAGAEPIDGPIARIVILTQTIDDDDAAAIHTEFRNLYGVVDDS